MRPVNQVKIDAVQTESCQAPFKCCYCGFGAVAITPDLSGDVDVVARHTGASDPIADSRLVCVERSRIDAAVAESQCGLDCCGRYLVSGAIDVSPI
jgi:hypothetical protein